MAPGAVHHNLPAPSHKTQALPRGPPSASLAAYAHLPRKQPRQSGANTSQSRSSPRQCFRGPGGAAGGAAARPHRRGQLRAASEVHCGPVVQRRLNGPHVGRLLARREHTQHALLRSDWGGAGGGHGVGGVRDAAPRA